VLEAARDRLDSPDVKVIAAAPVLLSDPVGPSRRRYANSAAVIETTLEPPEMLALLKRIEREFGRRSGGQRWAARVLDLDLVLWSGGCFAAPDLIIPHALFRERAFVLAPAAIIAPRWRDPVTRLTVRQLNARLARRAMLQPRNGA
jgi:2-amino-4-hydroxy-6-hydroxymethyldihydropteridine diphosphokinase